MKNILDELSKYWLQLSKEKQEDLVKNIPFNKGKNDEYIIGGLKDSCCCECHRKYK